jgi:hypothetical protein
MGRTILATCLAVFLGTIPAFAGEKNSADKADAISADKVEAVADTAVQTPVLTAAPGPAWTGIAGRPSILTALYGGSAALQAFDAYSTLKALKGGAVEANPLMKSVVGNPGLFIGIKATVSAASILAAEQMWRNHHRVAAIVMMAASNGFMAAVAAHNASVLNAQQR